MHAAIMLPQEGLGLECCAVAASGCEDQAVVRASPHASALIDCGHAREISTALMPVVYCIVGRADHAVNRIDVTHLQRAASNDIATNYVGKPLRPKRGIIMYGDQMEVRPGVESSASLAIETAGDSLQSINTSCTARPPLSGQNFNELQYFAKCGMDPLYCTFGFDPIAFERHHVRLARPLRSR